MPELVAYEIVATSSGVRSTPSAFSHFPKTLSSNWPRPPTFYRITAGSNPARVAIFHAHAVQQQRHDVENVASAGAAPKRDSAIARRHEARSRLGTAAGAATPALSTLFGPKLRQRSSRLLTGIAGCMSLWIDHFQPVGETASRLAYIQKSEAHILHGRPYFCGSESGVPS